MKSKIFGKHVAAFVGSINGGSHRKFIGCCLTDSMTEDFPSQGEWLTPTEARRLAKNLLDAADYCLANTGKTVREVEG